MAEAMAREANSHQHQQEQDNEDSDNEEVSERNRKQALQSDHWKDDNEKGTGDTQRL